MKLKPLFVALVFATLTATVSAQGKEGAMNITVTIGDAEYAVQFDDNAAVASLFPLSVNMKEWAANKEYYAELAKTISSTAPAATAIAAGDIMFYRGRSLVIFYGDSANTSGYIKLGYIADAKNLKAALDKAKGNVSFARAKSAEKEKGRTALTPEQQEVYAAYEEICRALIAKARATLERYYDKDLIFTHIHGKRQTRTEYLDEVMDGTLNYYKITPKDYTIRVNGDTAYMSVTHTLDAKVYGMTGSWTLRGNGTYKKRSGIWMSVQGADPN